MHTKRLFSGLALAVLVVAGTGFGLSRLSCVPNEPSAISQDFMHLVQAGELNGAYQLTDRGMSVGRTLAAFEANIRDQLRIDAFPTHRDIKFSRNRSGFQSCGNRLRRWILKRKISPDQISLDYIFGHPFEIRLTSDDKGQWRISFFQSHAM